MTLTKEWLQKQITDLEATRDEIPFGLDEDGSNTLAALKMALAGMETKHNSVIAEQLDHVLSVMDVTAHQRAVISCAVDRLNKSAELLQQSPQPLTTSERAELENYRNAQQVVPHDVITRLTHEANHVTAWHHMDEHSCKVNRRDLLALVNACRAAMQGKADSPVIQDGWVDCGEQMPSIGVPVITADGDVVQYATYAWNGKEWQDWYEEYDKLPANTFTHWRPRPAAPQQEAK